MEMISNYLIEILNVCKPFKSVCYCLKHINPLKLFKSNLKVFNRKKEYTKLFTANLYYDSLMLRQKTSTVPKTYLQKMTVCENRLWNGLVN